MTNNDRPDTRKNMKPTDKKLAEFFGITQSTYINWRQPSTQVDPTTGETMRFYPPTGRHNLAKAAKLYYYLIQKDEDGLSNLDTILSLNEALEMGLNLLEKEGEMDINGAKVSFKEMGMKIIKDVKEKLEKTTAGLICTFFKY